MKRHGIHANVHGFKRYFHPRVQGNMPPMPVHFLLILNISGSTFVTFKYSITHALVFAMALAIQSPVLNVKERMLCVVCVKIY